MSELEKKESIRISPVGHISIYVRKRPTKSYRFCRPFILKSPKVPNQAYMS